MGAPVTVMRRARYQKARSTDSIFVVPKNVSQLRCWKNDPQLCCVLKLNFAVKFDN